MIDRIGNCRILEEIGSGGMAVIYKAIQEPLGRFVAVKALKSSVAADPTFAQRFEREANFMATMQHENILHVHDFIKQGDTMFIVMEYVQGIDLYDVLEKVHRLPVEVAAAIALQVARALDYAHFRGIIHRDIKPANIMLSRRGEVKLMDFGIARDDSLHDLTETGTGLGTPSFMSPEQIQGDKIDFRSDIFSLGIVLYMMLTGVKPFVEDDDRSVMQKIRLDRPISPRKLAPNVPRAIERILARCVEKAPAHRYPSMHALAYDLEELLAPRIELTYNALLVEYLRDQGMVPAEEANLIITSAQSQTGRAARAGRGSMRQIVGVTGLLSMLVVGTGAFLERGGQRARAETSLEPAPATGLLDLTRAGYLRVLAEPWAEVYVDGLHVDTTPSARRVALSPGAHMVRLENPNLESYSAAVTIRAGEVTEVRARLRDRGRRDGAGRR